VNDYAVVVAGVAKMLAPYTDRIQVEHLHGTPQDDGEVDVILFDTFGYQGRPGQDLAELVVTGGAKLVVFSWTTDDRAIAVALQAGAAGYVSKTVTAEELAQALEDVHAGLTVTQTGAEAQVAERSAGSRAAWPGHDHGLSSREAEVLALIAEGLTNDEVADKLYLSLNTVKTYIRTGYQKIGVSRRSQAVVWALQHGFAGTSDEPHSS
jgi:two-component system, NarL family, response regulator LiaR